MTDACKSVFTAYIVGAPVTPRTVYGLDQSGCEAELADPNKSYWTTAPADDTRRATITARTE